MPVHHKVTSTEICRKHPFIHQGGETQHGAKFLAKGNNTTAETRLEPSTSRFKVRHANHYTTMSLLCSYSYTRTTVLEIKKKKEQVVPISKAGQPNL